MSETSSISIEATTDSRDTSVATSVLLPFPASRGREEADNRSEHSYSESGASGSSFEELDLEAAADGEGTPGLLLTSGYAESRSSQTSGPRSPSLLSEEKSRAGPGPRPRAPLLSPSLAPRHSRH